MRWRNEGWFSAATFSPAAADLNEDEGASRERRARREDGMREEEGGEEKRAEWRGRWLDEGRKRGNTGRKEDKREKNMNKVKL